MNNLSVPLIVGYAGFLLAWFFLLVEAYGLIALKNIYSRFLLSSLADTVAILLLFTGILLVDRTLASSGKMLVLLAFLLVMNPITSHLIARSARRNGIGLDDKKKED